MRDSGFGYFHVLVTGSHLSHKLEHFYRIEKRQKQGALIHNIYNSFDFGPWKPRFCVNSYSYLFFSHTFSVTEAASDALN